MAHRVIDAMFVKPSSSLPFFSKSLEASQACADNGFAAPLQEETSEFTPPLNTKSLRRTISAHEEQVELLRSIAESLRPLPEMVRAQKETVELQREVASSLRQLTDMSRVKAPNLTLWNPDNSLDHIPEEEMNKPTTRIGVTARLPAAEKAEKLYHDRAPQLLATGLMHPEVVNKNAKCLSSECKADVEGFATCADKLMALPNHANALLRKPLSTPFGASALSFESRRATTDSLPSLLSGLKPGLKVPTQSMTFSSLQDPQAHREIYCRFNVFNIEEINIKKQSIKADFYFEAAWEMPELLYETDGFQALVPEGDVDWTQVFQPKIIFTNKIGDLHVQSWNAVDPGNWQKFGKPMASWRAKVSGEFHQELDLHAFPYDKQLVSIGISTDHMSSVCSLVPNEFVKSAAPVQVFSIRDQFTLKFDANHSVQVVNSRRGAGGEYSQLRLTVGAHRNPTFFLVNVILLMFLLVIVYFIAVIPISPFKVAERMEIAANIVLTGVALKLLSAERLPDLPYLTCLDKYLLGSIGLIVAMIGEVFICYKFVPESMTVYVDTLVLNTVAGLWILAHIPVFQPLWRSGIHQCVSLCRWMRGNRPS